MADKRGVRFCGIQEPEHDDVIHVGLMKELTGNDTILARALYSDPFYYKPQFKLVLTCNKLPHIPSNDGGVWRRLCVSPFEAKFVDKPSAPNEFLKDKALVEKLADWKQPFVWLLLNKYYKAYTSVGLVKPEIVKKYTTDYQKNVDIFLEFLSMATVKTNIDEDTIKLPGLYGDFKFWYKQSYTKQDCPDKKTFCSYLADHKYKMLNDKVLGVKLSSDN